MVCQCIPKVSTLVHKNVRSGTVGYKKWLFRGLRIALGPQCSNLSAIAEGLHCEPVFNETSQADMISFPGTLVLLAGFAQGQTAEGLVPQRNATSNGELLPNNLEKG